MILFFAVQLYFLVVKLKLASMNTFVKNIFAKIKEHFPNSLKHFPFFQATCTHTNQIT